MLIQFCLTLKRICPYEIWIKDESSINANFEIISRKFYARPTSEPFVEANNKYINRSYHQISHSNKLGAAFVTVQYEDCHSVQFGVFFCRVLQCNRSQHESTKYHTFFQTERFREQNSPEYQRQRTKKNARSERRHGRTEISCTVRRWSICSKTVKNRHVVVS